MTPAQLVEVAQWRALAVPSLGIPTAQSWEEQGLATYKIQEICLKTTHMAIFRHWPLLNSELEQDAVPAAGAEQLQQCPIFRAVSSRWRSGHHPGLGMDKAESSLSHQS